MENCDKSKKKKKVAKYRVKNGDTLASISVQFDVSIEALKKVNRLVTTALFPNEVLNIPIDENSPQSFAEYSHSQEKISMELKQAVSEEIVDTKSSTSKPLSIPSKVFNKQLGLLNGNLKFIEGAVIFQGKLHGQTIVFDGKKIVGITLHPSDLPGPCPVGASEQLVNFSEKKFILDERESGNCVHLKMKENKDFIDTFKIEVHPDNVDFVFTGLLGFLVIGTPIASPGVNRLSLGNNNSRKKSTVVPRSKSDHDITATKNRQSKSDTSVAVCSSSIEESLFDYGESELMDKSELIDNAFLSWIRPSLPPNLFDNDWHLLYSSSKNGFSLATIFRMSKDTGPCVLVCKDKKGWIFGCFCSEELHKKSELYYGTGESFLFRSKPTRKVYHFTQNNQLLIYNTEKSISMGNENGKPGFWLDGELNNGLSYPCTTFDNETLSSTPEFKCISIEIWIFK